MEQICLKMGSDAIISFSEKKSLDFLLLNRSTDYITLVAQFNSTLLTVANMYL